ncbi:MAG: aminotransferase class V-fold PLP-dependent enzyme, partial [Pseudomonadota bacterium]
ANSETGVMQALPPGIAVSDFTQAFGKVPVSFAWSGAEMALVSAHKLGGPKGVGALILKQGLDVSALIRGGGQEMGRRSGTENVIGIAGFGAAAAAAQRDLETGVWSRVEEFRNILEISLEGFAQPIIFIGKESPRLPNTSCFIAPGWRGETQVMQMDLAGFAVSAGSACSSGKVKASGVLTAMGHGAVAASQAIRVSIGPTTTEEDIRRFATTWGAKYEKIRARAA